MSRLTKLSKKAPPPPSSEDLDDVTDSQVSHCLEQLVHLKTAVVVTNSMKKSALSRGQRVSLARSLASDLPEMVRRSFRNLMRDNVTGFPYGAGHITILVCWL